MNKNMTYYSYSVNDTRNIAEFISEMIMNNSCIYISGEVGAGKTCLSKFIANYFDINDLNSASYTKVTSFSGTLNIIHCDFYNSKPNQIFIETEVMPNLVAPWILIVEWPHMFYEIECNQLIHIKLETTGNYSRKISFTCFKP